MSSTVQTGIDVHPFQVEIPNEALDDLRRRIAATRWPSKELVGDRSQGVQLATIQELARYWTTDYDFGRVEARLNALPQFVTEIDGVDIHFIHVKSSHENALPLIMNPRLARLRHGDDRLRRPADGPDRARRQGRGCLPPRAAFTARVRLLGRAGRGRLGARPDRTSLGRACAASATPVTSPRAATWAPSSPTRWAARHRRG